METDILGECLPMKSEVIVFSGWSNFNRLMDGLIRRALVWEQLSLCYHKSQWTALCAGNSCSQISFSFAESKTRKTSLIANQLGLRSKHLSWQKSLEETKKDKLSFSVLMMDWSIKRLFKHFSKKFDIWERWLRLCYWCFCLWETAEKKTGMLVVPCFTHIWVYSLQGENVHENYFWGEKKIDQNLKSIQNGMRHLEMTKGKRVGFGCNSEKKPFFPKKLLKIVWAAHKSCLGGGGGTQTGHWTEGQTWQHDTMSHSLQ